MFHRRIPANELRQTLDYAERICSSPDWLTLHYGITDFRMVAGQLVDLGAPISDWRFDPRVFDVRIPDALPVYYVGDERRYGGEAGEALRGIREDYRRRLTDWLFADKAPVPSTSDAAHVCHFLIQHMPSVEDFVDEGFPITAGERAAA